MIIYIKDTFASPLISVTEKRIFIYFSLFDFRNLLRNYT